MEFFAIKNITFDVWGYELSYVELIGTLFGLLSVYYASKANILTWGTGIVNEVFLFILFFQVQLYSDMVLQIYFFIVTLYGWYKWKSPSIENKISTINLRNKILITSLIFVCTVISGFFFKNIHLYLPGYFTIPAAYPFADSFIMVTSIVASILLAKKKIENWHLWIVGNLVCIIVYFNKHVYFLSLEYLIFLVIALYGLFHWQKQLKDD